MSKTITAYFETMEDAQMALDTLRDTGITDADMHIYQSGNMSAEPSSGTEGKGFWASLGDMFMPEEDQQSYAEGLRRGGAVLTVQAAEGDFDSISDILEDAGSVDMDTQEASWRADGWSGYDEPTLGRRDDTMSGGTMSAEGQDDVNYRGTAGSMPMGGSVAKAMSAGVEDDGLLAGRDNSDDGYIPVAREELRIGKREVDHGRVRVRSYVVETPVEEHVNLREETVRLERSPANRAATADDGLFQDRTIEVKTRREEAVVSKEARVVEEIRVNKDVTERDHLVSDTVRHTEVEIDDDRVDSDMSDEDILNRPRD